MNFGIEKGRETLGICCGFLLVTHCTLSPCVCMCVSVIREAVRTRVIVAPFVSCSPALRFHLPVLLENSGLIFRNIWDTLLGAEYHFVMMY